MPSRYPCGTCIKPVAKNHRAIICDFCNNWTHAKCNNISKTKYDDLMNDVINSWCCIKCLNEAIPLPNSDEETEGKLFDSACYKNRSTDIFKDIDNINLYEEVNLILNNCLYYDLTEFSQISKTNETFSVLHLNIASLALHFDELHTILANSNIEFDIIGITETGFKTESTQNC